jgi:hypothetical protein
MRAICTDCGLDMERSCTVDPGRVQHDGGLPCRDCATPPGGLHHRGCCVEACPYGHRRTDGSLEQAITCLQCWAMQS